MEDKLEALQKRLQTLAADQTTSMEHTESDHSGQTQRDVSRLSHDMANALNNLLTVILCNAELALHALPSDSVTRPYLKAVFTCSKRAADLVRHVAPASANVTHHGPPSKSDGKSSPSGESSSGQ